MGFRFWRRVRIVPGVTLNLSKSGGSVSFGPRGSKLTVGPRGRRATVGIPGTGLFYTTTLGSGRKGRGTGTAAVGSAPASPSSPAEAAAFQARTRGRLTLGFFQRLITPDDEEALVDGCREMFLGNDAAALDHLRRAAHLADGAFLAGCLAFKQERLEEAARHLAAALDRKGELGRHLARYGITAEIGLPITGEIAAHVGPDERGALLALTEVCQHLGRHREARDCLTRLHELEPDDVLVRLSLAELLIDGASLDEAACREVLRLSEGVGNDSAVHAALLLYRAKALGTLGLPAAARDVLTLALRRRKDRPEDLLLALRYERALACEAMGDGRRARTELERLYAEAPDYEDVAARLGVAGDG